MSNINNCSGWKSQANQRIPPVCPDDSGQVYWSYDKDSWSWRPKPLNQNILTKPETWGNYREYAIEELRVKNPLITMRGGMSDLDIAELENATIYNYPDLRSETKRSEAIQMEYWEALAKRSLIPTRPVY